MLKKFALLSLLFCFHASFALDKFVIHSIPKCGTHFLEKTITELTGTPTFYSGDPFPVKLAEADKGGKILRFATPFNPNQLQLLMQKDYKLICIYRDPRDAFISLVVYLRTFKGKGIRRDFFEVAPNFDDLSFNEQLLSVMVSKNKQGNYFSFYLTRHNWRTTPIAYGVKYENLVGSHGGGDDALQVQEIVNMAKHINLPITSNQAQEVASKIYHSSGKEIIDGKEFTHGTIGSWKKFMHPVHKEIFKNRFGDLLIKLGYENDKNW